MKKLARLTALLLTCALLLVLTACGAKTEQQAKQRLLNEINSYRATLELDPLVEVKQLSDAEQELIEHFRAGPIANYISKGIAWLFTGMFAVSPLLAGAVIGATRSLLVYRRRDDLECAPRCFAHLAPICGEYFSLPA